MNYILILQGMRGKKDLMGPMDLEENENEYEKRAPMGFQGMRGKKDFLESNVDDHYSLINNIDDGDYEKRAMMGFQGMRGKKAISDDDLYKRAPMGFQGMRGKKSLEEVRELRINFHEIVTLLRYLPAGYRRDRKTGADGLPRNERQENVP